MADQSQVERLLRSVEEWNEWREENLGALADLMGADLYVADLRGANLSGQELFEAKLVEANLNGANLCGADLTRANLTRADLTRANLGVADLREANLSRANLRGAELSGADLSKADLRGADLSGANLCNANLSRANLTRAHLRKTEFERALFFRTALGDVDLRGSLGLDFTRHAGASTIGIDTFYRSKGQIPAVFLRGAGVPENLIVLQRSLTAASAIEFYSCFISYSHQDTSFARRLHDSLQARGIRCWLDEKRMKIGEEILDVVLDAIRVHDRVILCASRASLDSEWVETELEEAFEKERAQGRPILLPLALDGYLLDGWKGPNAVKVRRRLAADFTGWENDNAKFEEQFERVVKALRLESKEAPEGKL